MLSLQIAVGALTAMKEASDGNVARYAVGSDPSQYKLFTGGHFWARADRPGMTKIYQQVLFSSMELSGAEHFDAPAEWQASVIAAFVHPANYMSACSWFVASVEPALDVAKLGSAQPVVAVPTNPRTLFALVCAIRSVPECQAFRDSFEKHVNVQILKREVKK